MYQLIKNVIQRVQRALPSSQLWKNYSSENIVSEKTLSNLLKQRFPNANEIQVTDTSGGCGAMFEIFVKSKEFEGLSVLKQHKAITDTLKEQIKMIHGLRIDTKV